MTQILAFSGRKQSGKSTAAEYVEMTIEHFNLPLSYKTYSFADPLKYDICINILGLTHNQCYGSEEDKNTLTDLEWDGKKLTAREAMEIIGTDIFRRLKNSVWVDATINKIKKENLDLAIIPDCRFPNEVDAIIQQNGYVIRLDRDPFGSQSNSECALDENKYNWINFSSIIRNQDMTIIEKNKAVHTFLKNKGIFPL
jgi:hypothetical protein